MYLAAFVRSLGYSALDSYDSNVKGFWLQVALGLAGLLGTIGLLFLPKQHKVQFRFKGFMLPGPSSRAEAASIQSKYRAELQTGSGAW